ncbi:MAG: hypothetical protein EA422_04530, partial [Gemmatimonadales bacterium]
MTATPGSHDWRFFRSGGFDQVALDRGVDLLHLDELDPKLWTVLNCPTQGLEFDARTAALVDTDGDGQIRVPEIRAAVAWARARLTSPDVLLADAGLAPDSISTEAPEGPRLRSAAVKILEYLDRSPDSALQVSDFADMTRLFPDAKPNGDGVVPATMTDDEELAAVIGEVVETLGGKEDRSGNPGVDAALVETFFKEARAVLAWHEAGEEGGEEIRPLGADTAVAAAALDAVRTKVEDYFARCRLAAFDPRAAGPLNPAESVYGALADRAIATDEADVAALPLAAVEADQPLPLRDGLNPAWVGAMERFRASAVEPLLGEVEELSEEAWQELTHRFDPWAAWQAQRPDTPVHALPVERLRELVDGEAEAELGRLIERDLEAETSAATIDAVERLVRYQAHLVTLLRNFVTMSDFYRDDRKAVFQAGTLYLDQRSCELVMHVADMGRHATMAPFSGCYLVYCTCVRQGAAPISIVAALTGGEVDELMVPGRNGVFWDREGRDWKATVVKVVEQPVSIRQAFWAPYRRVARFVEEQLRKFAASRDEAVEARGQAGVGDAAARAQAGGEGGGAAAQSAGAQAFDIAKFAGIFAAIGLAIGAIGTALAAMVAGLFTLPLWQVPLVIAGVILLISGPSMLLAFLTLRRRSLGPLLDANGWAVNARARINVPFGAALTGVAALPPGSSRSMVDPYAEKRRPWRLWLTLAVLLFIALFL